MHRTIAAAAIVFALAAFALHTTAMALRGFRLNHCPVNNLYEATAFAMWSIVAVYLVVGLWPRLRFLGAFASPVLFAIGVFALMPNLDTAILTAAILGQALLEFVIELSVSL